jgi:hypothetical protein
VCSAEPSYVKNVTRVETRTANDPVTPKVVAPPPAPVALSVNGPDGGAWTAVAYATAPTGNWQLVNTAICG